MANIKCNGLIESKSINIKGITESPSIKFKTSEENTNAIIEAVGNSLKITAQDGISINDIDLISRALTVDSYYIDPCDIGESGDVTTSSYIKFRSIFGGKSLVVCWGATPNTNSDGYLSGTTSGVSCWIPTSSEGVQHKIFTKPGQFRTVVTPYGGTQYAYGWRVINYPNDEGYCGFNLRYGNGTSGIRFNYIIIGLV